MLAVGSTVYVKQEKAFMRTSEATQKKHPNEKSKLMENVNDFLPQYMNRDRIICAVDFQISEFTQQNVR